MEWEDNELRKDSWENAIKYCENLIFDEKDDWRLPNKNELIQLLISKKIVLNHFKILILMGIGHLLHIINIEIMKRLIEHGLLTLI